MVGLICPSATFTRDILPVTRQRLQAGADRRAPRDKIRAVSVGAPAKSAETPAPTTSRELIASATQPLDVPRRNRVYVNRNLRLDKIEMVGFDMDYTLALYNQARIEELSMRATLHKLVTAKGYPAAIQGLAYDPMLAVRGLVVDRVNGNIFKPDRYGFPGTRAPRAFDDRPFEGRRALPARAACGCRTSATPGSIRCSRCPRRCSTAVWSTTSIATTRPASPTTRRCGSTSASASTSRTAMDRSRRSSAPSCPTTSNVTKVLADTLHKFRSSGKRLFLLTNSAWDYTSQVMSYLLDGVRGGYPSWRNYFDIIVVSAAKPEFFTDEHPFVELDGDGEPDRARRRTGPFQRGRVYSGGNIKAFQTRAHAHGDRVLFVGDHIYGDMLRSREVVQLAHGDGAAGAGARDHDVRPAASRAVAAGPPGRGADPPRRRAVRTAGGDALAAEADGGEARGTRTTGSAREAHVKDAIERLRRDLRETAAQHRSAEAETDDAFNPYWGPLFREGYEVSKFGEQVEAYACVYTSRVSNFRFYSPMQYFRGPRDRMPHER